MKLPKLLAILSILLTLPVAVAAAEMTSTYTKIILDKCALREAPTGEDTFGGSWDCPGFAGIPVYVAEGDLRMFVSFGADAENEPAAGQTLPNFNTINETLEWRLRNGRPIATILRWFPDKGDGGKPGSILIVTRVAPGSTCQIARIDAQANRNANVMARQAADTLSDRHNCNEPPVIIGNPGMLN